MGSKGVFKVMPLGSPHTTKTVLILLSTTLIILSTAVVVDSVRCLPGVEYWDSAQDNCVNCTKCSEIRPKGQMVVIRPCEMHRNTLCGPLKDLYLDWSWLKKLHTTKPSVGHHHHHHKHHHHHHHHHKNRNEDANAESLASSTETNHHGRRKHHRASFELDDGSSYHGDATEEYVKLAAGDGTERKSKEPAVRMIWRLSNADNSVATTTTASETPRDETNRRHKTRQRGDTHSQKYATDPSAALSDDDGIPSDVGNSDGVVRDRVKSGGAAVSDEPAVKNDAPVDSSVVDVGADGPEVSETFIWDWQAIVLAMAVCACILFFVVAAIYSVHHARQWKRLKENFEADVEELSARLGLMVASGELNGDGESTRSPSNENYHNNQCVYLEQLLVRKDTKSGPKIRSNVYIEENNTSGNNVNITETSDSRNVK